MTVVIFDLDDTLYLESEFARSGFRHLDTSLRTRGISGFFERAWERFCAGHRTKIFDAVLAELGVDASEAKVRELVEMFRSHRPEISLAPDAAWLLDHWAGERALGLITDGWSLTQHQKIDALALRQRLACIVVSDDLGGPDFWKPSPAPFEAVMSRMGPREKFVYVGDNPHKDFVTARKLGWKTVRVRRKGGLHEKVEPLSGYESHHVVEDLRALSSLL
ncbi:MAG: hypothetical protein B6A08_00840 [Sorangiineae bacterium NIC37A_2]|nr:MAG: hypothetical protein B6A08_00840 [Sorangiineae bacterium NIC37A_2]